MLFQTYLARSLAAAGAFAGGISKSPSKSSESFLLFPRGCELILQSAEAASDELLGNYIGRRSEDADALLGNYVGQRAQVATNADELLGNNIG